MMQQTHKINDSIAQQIKQLDLRCTRERRTCYHEIANLPAGGTKQNLRGRGGIRFLVLLSMARRALGMYTGEHKASR